MESRGDTAGDEAPGGRIPGSIQMLGRIIRILLAAFGVMIALIIVYFLSGVLDSPILRVLVGAVLFVPFVLFGTWHFLTSWRRTNKAAIRRGLYTFAFGLLVCATGFALFQFEGLPQLPTGSASRLAVYWLHVVVPFAAAWAYVSHRKKGPKIRWWVAKWWMAGVALFAGGMLVMHGMSPHRWFAEGPKEGEQYFHPSEARTADGKFIPAESLMSDTYCMQCHEDIYKDHLHSAHKFSSFNNPAYLASVKDRKSTRRTPVT